MEFKIRTVYPYLDVSITEGNTRIDLGFLNQEERKRLAEKLREAADELVEGIEL